MTTTPSAYASLRRDTPPSACASLRRDKPWREIFFGEIPGSSPGMTY
ncbi:MAG: hypothetical protein LBB23_01400 [Rickettsiales bacterium]|nr:hypothetical protein [Rickettsiales bacterium]